MNQELKVSGAGGISVRVILDSVSPAGARILTMVWRYHRFILPEVNTHRILARNSASSRAIPVERILAQVERDPALPIRWGANRPGMQAREELDEVARAECERLVREHALASAALSRRLSELGLHKQVANRYTEPFRFVETLVTATEWGNLFNLRCHPDAQPEFEELALCALEAWCRSKPVERTEHLPFCDPAEVPENALVYPEVDRCWKLSTARCARISYRTYDGRSSADEDVALHDRLRASGHFSPFEHPCWAADSVTVQSGPFRGWHQYRKILDDENRTEFDPEELFRRCGRHLPGSSQQWRVLCGD